MDTVRLIDGSSLSADLSSRIVVTMGGDYGVEDGRFMKTYVNGKVCASIRKGVFQKPDDRFGLSAACLFLFGSTNEAYMPGIRVRYVDIRPTCLSPEVIIPLPGSLF